MPSDEPPRHTPLSTGRDPALSAPPPKTARGVKIALGVATVLLGLVALAIWGLIRAFAG
jgi:hypothetical protein